MIPQLLRRGARRRLRQIVDDAMVTPGGAFFWPPEALAAQFDHVVAEEGKKHGYRLAVVTGPGTTQGRHFLAGTGEYANGAWVHDGHDYRTIFPPQNSNTAGTPTIAPGTQAGTGAVAGISPASTNASGTITITMGTNPPVVDGADLADLTYSSKLAKPISPILTLQSSDFGLGAGAWVNASITSLNYSAGGFMVQMRNPDGLQPPSGAVVVVNYSVPLPPPTPTLTLLPAAGVGAKGVILGADTDTSGTISITFGSGVPLYQVMDVCQLTYSTPFPYLPSVQLTGGYSSLPGQFGTQLDNNLSTGFQLGLVNPGATQIRQGDVLKVSYSVSGPVSVFSYPQNALVLVGYDEEWPVIYGQIGT